LTKNRILVNFSV